MTAPATRVPGEEHTPEPVCVETSGTLHGTGPVHTEFRYDPAHPFTVTIVFIQAGQEDVDWSFSRELLDAGLKDHAGQGDVRIWPTDTGTVEILLDSPDGRALFEFNKKVLRDFLRATYQQVPRHKETKHIDVDNAIQKILTGRSPF